MVARMENWVNTDNLVIIPSVLMRQYHICLHLYPLMFAR